MPTPPAVLVVLLDAMEQGLARRLAAEGRMPTLARLLERSGTTPTEAPLGFFVGGVWPSFFKSVNTGRHGQHSWREFDPVTYIEKEPPYEDGEGEPFWRTLDRAGLRTLVLDVPRSVCVPLEHGVAVHDLTTHDPLEPGVVSSPPALAAELERRFARPAYVKCDDWPRGTAEEVRDFGAQLESRIALKESLVTALAGERGPFDVLVVGFAEAHCAGHHFWHLHDPAHPQHDPALARAVGEVLPDVYARLDTALARVLALAPPESRVLVLLSHGMGPHYDGTHLLDRLLARIGRELPGTRPLTLGERLMRLRSRERRPKRSVLKRLWRRWPSLRFRPVFTVENNEAWAGMRLNLAGRERHGLVDSARRDEALAWLEALLATAVNPGTGAPAFTRIERRAAITWGSRGDQLPDLVAEWSRAGPFDALEIPALGRVEGRSPATRTGDHRREGLALVSGPDLPQGPLGRHVSVMDLAPTICSWLGVEMPRPDGHVIAEWRARERARIDT